MAKAKSEKIMFYGTGRRKKSIARVRLVEGTGKITINGKDIDEYFGTETLKVIVKQPLNSTNTLGKYDVICKVIGGGFTGQAGAIRHGISRALLEANGEYRPTLKSAGFLTRQEKLHNLARDKKSFYQKQFNLRSFNTSEVFCCSVIFTINILKRTNVVGAILIAPTFQIRI